MFTQGKCCCGTTTEEGACVCKKCRHKMAGTARILLSLVFVVGGISFLMTFGDKADMLGNKEYVIPLFGIIPGILMALVGVVLKLGGGIALLVGYRVREAALALILYIALATLMFHVGEGQLTAALSNIALIGGLFAIIATGGGGCRMCKAEGSPSTQESSGSTE